MIRSGLSKFVAIVTVGTLAVSSLTGCSSLVSTDATKLPLEPALTTQEVMDFYANAMKYDSVVNKAISKESTYELKDVDDDTASKLKDLASSAQGILGQATYPNTPDNNKIVTSDTFDYIKSYLNNLKLDNPVIQQIKETSGYYFVDVQYDASARSVSNFTQKTSLLGIDGAFNINDDGVDSIDTVFLADAADKLNEYYKENNIDKSVTFDDTTAQFTESGSGEVQDVASVDPNTVGTVAGDTTTDVTGDITTVGNGGDTTTDVTTPTVNAAGATTTAGTVTNTAETTDVSVGTDETAANETAAVGADGTTVAGDGTTVAGDGTTVAGDGTTVAGDTQLTDSNGNTVTNIASDSRTCAIDISEMNSVVGASNTSVAYMPALSEVFNIPENEGTIGGIGIYPAGDGGLKQFGFDSSKISGKITLRYVFKDTVDGSGDIIGVNIYPIDETLNGDDIEKAAIATLKASSGSTSDTTITDESVAQASTIESEASTDSSTDVDESSESDDTSALDEDSLGTVIPTFLQTQLSELIERVDRADIDFLVSPLISGELVDDMGFAVLRGYEYNTVNLQKNMSTIRKIVARDMSSSTYLLKVETTRMEGPKDVDRLGTYRDTSYVVVKQSGDSFIITDWLRTDRKLVTEPAIDTTMANEKRLVALNFTGAVDDTQKTPIKELLNNLYSAGTYRVLNGPKDITYKGSAITVDFGMYDCFDSDTSLLSSTDKEYMNSELRNVLTKHGTDVGATYSGVVTEWMDGNANQVELTTEELISYDGLDKGEYMTVYYLVSHMGSDWVIDERKVLTQSEVTGSDLKTIESRIAE